MKVYVSTVEEEGYWKTYGVSRSLEGAKAVFPDDIFDNKEFSFINMTEFDEISYWISCTNSRLIAIIKAYELTD
jgi:hypothetical protein